MSKSREKNTPGEPNADLKQYRNQLVLAEAESQRSYDTTLISLSGGALGLSISFITNIVSKDHMAVKWLLVSAWGAWAFSLLVMLASFLASAAALREAIKQVDTRTIYEQPPGGRYDCLTLWLNRTGGLLFVCGVILIVIFIGMNI
jgi:hypothetical protein